MPQAATQQISIREFIDKADVDNPTIRQKHQNLLNSSQFLRDSNVKDHFCVYFAGIDLRKKKVFMGHHIKAGLWLFNGGHLDKNETVSECLFREIGEEWGVAIAKESVIEHFRLSITPINNPKQPLCSHHYDLWHFLDLNSEEFEPDMQKVVSEFHEIKWVSIQEAEKITNDPNTRATLNWLKNSIVNYS